MKTHSFFSELQLYMMTDQRISQGYSQLPRPPENTKTTSMPDEDAVDDLSPLFGDYLLPSYPSPLSGDYLLPFSSTSFSTSGNPDPFPVQISPM